jgi:hypothetical protein
MLMGLEEQLSKIKQIGLLALEQKSDEDIAKEIKMPVAKVQAIRTSLGIYRHFTKDIFAGYERKIIFPQTSLPTIQFTLPKYICEQMGIKSSKAGKYVFTGKLISKNKIEITVKEEI